MEAYECDPGCTCDNILIEYTDVWETQDEIVDSIVQLQQQIKLLTERESEIIEICPNYVEIDGDWYYDLGATDIIESIDAETVEEIDMESI